MFKFEKKVADDYNFRFQKYGAQPKSSLWFSEKRQIFRFDLIIKCIKTEPMPSRFSINDIGCGYGGFLKRLQSSFRNQQFSYCGYDLAQNLVSYCQNSFSEKDGHFYCSGDPFRKADYSVMSGTFNYAPEISVNEWEEYLFAKLNSIWNSTNNSMIFNLMVSEQTKITPQLISYIGKEAVFNFCQNNLGRTFQYVSSKLPKEITFCVRRH